MKKTFTILSLVFTLIYVKAVAQIPTIKPFKLNSKQLLSKSSVYQENLNYSEFALDKNELGKINQNINRCNIEFTLSNNKTLVAVLNRFDIWDKNFEVKNEKGEKILFEKGNVFQGYLKDDTTSRVAVSIFKDAIDILIETKLGKYSLSSDFKTNTYTFEDVINADGNSCPVNDKIDIKIDGNTPNAIVGCKTFAIHVATDLNLLNYYSGNTSTVYQRVVTIFNQMIIPYHEQSVGVKLAGLTIFTTDPPFNYSNNSTLLNSFNSWYYTNISTSANMGHLFTSVGFSGVIGTAWVNNICSSNQPHTGWSKVNDSYGYLVAAHEIGHNLGSSHTNSSSIMDPYVNSGYSFDTSTGNLFRSGLNGCGQVDYSDPSELFSNNIAPTSTFLSWLGTPTSTVYTAYYRKLGEQNYSGITVNDNSATLTGLLSGVTYESKVAGDCSNGYSSIHTFTTAVNATISAGITNSTICPNENVTIDVITGGEINVGNLFTAQLSDAAGNFLNPTTIGTLFSKYSGTMQIKIPAYIASGSNYKIRIVGNSPSVTGVETYITIKPTPVPPNLTLSASNLFCNNNPINITASNCSGTLTWNPPITSSGNTVSIIPVDNISYSANCTGSNGCKSEKDTPTFKKVEAGTQNAVIQWEKSYGGSINDEFYDVVKISDGGYLLVGYSSSPKDGNKWTNARGQGDAIVIKIDKNGNREWEKTFGGTMEDTFYRIRQTPDNNFIIFGQSFSGVGYEKQSINKGNIDNWILKINVNGDVLWEVSLGSNAGEYTSEIAFTSDGGYILASSTGSTGTASVAANGDRTQNLKSESWDIWLYKIDANGQKIWDKVYGGVGQEYAKSIEKASDNSGFYIVGITQSASGAGSDITTSARHDYDGWLLKIDNNGNKVFDKTFSGGVARSPYTNPDYSWEYLNKIKVLPDGNYLIQAVSNNHAGNEKSQNSMGGTDIWLIKITPNGTILSDKVIGGIGNESEGDIMVLNDGSILLTAQTKSTFNVDIKDALKGVSDASIFKLDPNLNIIWSKNIGGSIETSATSLETIYKILNDGDDNFIFAGWSDESKGDREFAYGLDDAWVMKVNIPSFTKPIISASAVLICSGESITLTANGCTSNILWSNGAVTNSIVVNPNSDDNTYSVNCITNANACIGIDSDVFSVNIAASDLTLTGTAISGNKQAKGNIVSREIINSGVNVNYKAGKSIVLDKNQSFEAKTGSVFKAEIAACNLEQGMTGYYPFNGNVQDLSGNSRNGVLSGALYTKDRFGKPNSALSFDGIDDKVSLNYAYSGYQELTVSAWVNTKDLTNSFQTILGTNSAEFVHFQLYQDPNGALGWYYTTTNGGVNVGFNSFTSDMPYNPKSNWVHIVMKIKSGDSKVFLNGQVVKTNTAAYNFLTNTNLLKIGNGYQDSRFFKGEIDDLRIYNRALSDAEVIALYKSEAPNPSLSTGLFANYKFDGNANDVSGKGNNGTLIGGVGFTLDRFGQANKAINFDGVDDRINLANNNSISGFNEMTMSIWFKHDLAPTSVGNFFSKWSELSTNSYLLYLENRIMVAVANTSSGTFVKTTSLSTISPNVWHHCVATFDNSGIKLYLNGAIISQNTNAANVNYSIHDLDMGTYYFNQTSNYIQFFKGAMDDAKLYSRALSPLEVIQLYELEKP